MAIKATQSDGHTYQYVLHLTISSLTYDVTMIRDFSFISLITNATVFEMHRLVQLATRKWLEDQSQLERWKGQSVINLNAEFPSD